jgi:carbonic anhydrase/acetyltransferase-like protein (isoleucine patch superfamily)
MIDPTVFIARGAIVLGDVQIGRGSSVWYNCVIRGDTERITVGEQTNIQDLTMVHADPGVPCQIGSRVTVGHRVILHGCVVGDECLIGMGAVLLNGVRLGRGCVVGAGAVLLEGTEVEPGSLVVGLPGRVVRKVDEASQRRIEHAWRHYVAQADRHRERAFPIHTPTISSEPT